MNEIIPSEKAEVVEGELLEKMPDIHTLKAADNNREEEYKRTAEWLKKVYEAAAGVNQGMFSTSIGNMSGCAVQAGQAQRKIGI